MSDFNKEWDQKFNEFNNQILKSENEILNKQSEEKNELKLNLDEKTSKNVKFSKAYLDLKFQQMNLVKQQL